MAMLADTSPMGKALIGSMIIWAAVIIAAAVATPEAFGSLMPILGGGVAGHIVVLGGMARRADPGET